MTFLQHFTFVRLRCRIQAEAALRLPEFSGSALHGGLGMALRKTACAQPQRTVCGGCLLQRQCVYSLVFETPVPADAGMLRHYTAAPHPLEPPESGPQELPPGSGLDFGLVLIGRAIDLLPWFILAFEELGRCGLGGKIDGERGRFQLVNVRQAECVLYQQGAGTLSGHPLPESVPSVFPVCGSLRLTFHTPARIKYQEQFAEQLDFHILFRNLLRRISLLSFFHCGQRLDDSGFADLIRQAESIATVSHQLRWHEQERWSGRQKAAMKFGGLVGAVSYQGEFAPFMPYLALGEVLHCGKGCTFGLGRYSLEWPDQHEKKCLNKMKTDV